MAAEVRTKIAIECDGLGPNIVNFSKRFTDSNTPEDYRKIETIVSTTANLISTLVNIPSAEILGLGIIARDGDIYFNTISTNVSTAGSFIPDGQASFMTFSPGNSCVLSFKGSDADTAITALIYSALT